MSKRKWAVWSLWLALIGALSAFFWSSLSARPEQQFLIGPLTGGHHQIGVKCEACHTDPFGGGPALQNACVDCHGAELKQVHDSHPRSKFTDPRNVDRVALLDARNCVTCHREHTPETTRVMAVTMPDDYCALCHQDIATERTTHQNLDFTSCASAGCHNFHDNQALYEDFLIKHAHEPAFLADAKLPLRQPALHARAGSSATPLTLASARAPKRALSQPNVARQWLLSAHARGGVDCVDCHQDPATRDWHDQPGYQSCGTCHQEERQGFESGKHGMRLAQGLSPMTPAAARLPMHADAADKTLSCGSCHSPHGLDVTEAAASACQRCHDDEHSNAFAQSPHGRLWAQVEAGLADPDQGVSCATCHMPREHEGAGPARVQHNQNATLRPNEKMIRSVCMNCHGLEFSIDALADPALIRNNFSGKPARHVPSIDWALQHEREAADEKKRAAVLRETQASN